ncbi:MAG: hypothetical protein M3Y84_10065 [Acidobacteriota bacterium]|nr:hypothetical protein [Acidobacteriota bacterium]
MNQRLKAILFLLVDLRSIILAFAVFNFILIWTWDRNIGGIACVACPWYHSWSYSNEPTILLVAALFLRVNRWWGNTTAFVLAGYLIGLFFYLLSRIEDPVAGLRGDWRLIRMDYPYIVGSWDSQYLFALIILCCSGFYIARSILRRNAFRRTADNKSLDRSAGRVFLN